MQVTDEILRDAIRSLDAPLGYLQGLQRIGCITIEGTGPKAHWNASYLNSMNLNGLFTLYSMLKQSKLPQDLIDRVEWRATSYKPFVLPRMDGNA